VTWKSDLGARGRIAQRRCTRLDLDLEEVIEQLPPIHPGLSTHFRLLIERHANIRARVLTGGWSVERASWKRGAGARFQCLHQDVYAVVVEEMAVDAARRVGAFVPRRGRPQHAARGQMAGPETNQGARAARHELPGRRAEAEGFEPSMDGKAQTALAVRRHRPD
jgi:hypothetical protein